MMENPAHGKFIEDLNKQIDDEKAAFDEYQSLARAADDLGHYATGTTLRDISNDEHRHSVLLGQIVKRLSWTGGLPGAGLERPFPQTYDDWADLGIDIGAKDPSIADEVNNALTKIYEGIPSVADEAKRWLVQKAGELGIT